MSVGTGRLREGKRFGVAAIVVSAGWCLMWGAEGRAADSPDAEPPSVFIEVGADGQHCVIRKIPVECSEALAHLRNVLKLPPGTWVRFKASRAANYIALKKIMDDVTHSEYMTSIGYVRSR
jgi:biopolymer transport protein ExbD